MERVSSMLSSAGDTVATITVLLLPPRFSFSSQVRVESRYGTKLSLVIRLLQLLLTMYTVE